MKTNLTKNDSVNILKYYNVRIPDDEAKIIKMADEYINSYLCKRITNANKTYNYSIKDKKIYKCTLKKTKKFRNSQR